MAKQYWLQREGKTYGPYSGGKLKKLAALGKICDDDQLSADKQSWQLAGTIPGLFSLTTPPPQIASSDAPPSPEMSPSTGTASKTRRQRMSSSRQEHRLQPQSSRTKWIVIGVIGVAAVVLAVAIAVWPWMPPGEFMAFDEDELAQSNENSQDEAHSPGKPDVARTTPSPQTPRAATKPPGSRKSSPSVEKRPPEKDASKEKKVVAKKPVVTVEQFKEAATDFRAYRQKAGFPKRIDMASAIALVLMYGNGDEYKQANTRGPASLKNLFEQAEANRDALRGRCFYLDVPSESHLPVFIHDWSNVQATITVTVPFEVHGGGDGLDIVCFRQCDDPRGVAGPLSYHPFGVLLKNGKLRTTSQYGYGPMYGNEAMSLADQGAVIYARKQSYTCVDLDQVGISAEKADRYGVRKNGGGLKARIYFTELLYAGPMGIQERSIQKVRYFRLDQVRRFGSRHLENIIGWQETKQPKVFVTTMNDPLDYVSAKIVAIEVREPEGALLAKVDVGTTACSYLTQTSVAKEAAAVARAGGNDVAVAPRKQTPVNTASGVPKEAAAVAQGGGNDVAVAPRKQTPVNTASGVHRELTLDLGKGVTAKLVLIPAGKFMMGSPVTEEDRQTNEGPQREVMISNPFYMGMHEVTQAQWFAVMGTEPWKGKTNTKSYPSNAASYIGWDDASEFCEKLSRTTGKRVAIPTEAQWEYACRAGSETAYSFGHSTSKVGDYAWYKDNATYGKYAHAVGQKRPNAWGLYDMHGNIKEWCRDWYSKNFYVTAKNVDPENTTKVVTRITSRDRAALRVVRGGSWDSTPAGCRTAARIWGLAGHQRYSHRFPTNGFRVVISTNLSTEIRPEIQPSTKIVATGRETAAAKKLKLAKLYVSNEKFSLAGKIVLEILEKYPETKVAAEAKTLLKEVPAGLKHEP